MTDMASGEYVCDNCEVERPDYEGPGKHLPECPNCGATGAPRWAGVSTTETMGDGQ